MIPYGGRSGCGERLFAAAHTARPGERRAPNPPSQARPHRPDRAIGPRERGAPYGDCNRKIESCQALASVRGWDVVGIDEDNSISATNAKHRPALERALGMIERREVDVVVSWVLDQITRSMPDLESLIALSERHGVAVATVTGDLDLTTDTDRMLARILGAVAPGEVEANGARQEAAYVQAARDGKRHWAHRSLGLTRDGALHPAEAALALEV